MIRRLLELFPRDVLHIDGEPYMRRFYLAGYAPPRRCARCDGSGGYDGLVGWVDCPVCDGNGHGLRRSWWWRWGFAAVRVHEILTGDDERAFHDHPWSFVSIGLRGTYREEQPAWVAFDLDGETVLDVPLPGSRDNLVRWYRAPWLIRRRAEDLHALQLVDGTVWTLVVMGRKRRSWGFAGPFGWLHWRDFDAAHPGRAGDGTTDPDERVAG